MRSGMALVCVLDLSRLTLSCFWSRHGLGLFWLLHFGLSQPSTSIPGLWHWNGNLNSKAAGWTSSPLKTRLPPCPPPFAPLQPSATTLSPYGTEWAPFMLVGFMTLRSQARGLDTDRHQKLSLRYRCHLWSAVGRLVCLKEPIISNWQVSRTSASLPCTLSWPCSYVPAYREIQESLSGGSEMFDPDPNPQLTSLPTGSGNLATGNGLILRKPTIHFTTEGHRKAHYTPFRCCPHFFLSPLLTPTHTHWLNNLYRSIYSSITW